MDLDAARLLQGSSEGKDNWTAEQFRKVINRQGEYPPLAQEREMIRFGTEFRPVALDSDRFTPLDGILEIKNKFSGVVNP